MPGLAGPRFLGRLLPQPERPRPPGLVLAAIAPRPPLAPPHRQVDLPPALVQLLADLGARGARPDYQDGTRWELRGVAVLRGVELQELFGHRRVQRQGLGLLVG